MYAFPSGSHEEFHKSLEASGAIAHTWSKCPELSTPLQLKVWTRVSNWEVLDIPWRDNPWKDDPAE
jgi:hypothetical protein